MEAAEEVKFSAMMPAEKLDVNKHKAVDFKVWEQQWKEFCQFSGMDEQVGDGFQRFLLGSTRARQKPLKVGGSLGLQSPVFAASTFEEALRANCNVG
jgi:hypothetical protein